MKRKPNVILVGAGPGDKGLITLKGLEAIRRADCIVYDNLMNEALLEQAKPGCVLLYAGKSAGSHYLKQEQINDLLLECAGKYDTVVRLKGGDPYVFGRGGEEALCLREAGIDFEVVPGVTSAVAGLAYAGIPISHRGLAASFHVITAHTRDESAAEDYVTLAKLEGTLVFLMGLGRVRQLCDGLLAAGKDGSTPAAVVSRATRWGQRTVAAPLDQLADRVEKAGLEPPALVVVGRVVSLRDQLDFFEKLPLFGKNILVTRTNHQSAGLRERLERLGAETVAAPMLQLRTVPGALDQAMARIETYDYIVFTSQNSLDVFFEALFAAGLDVRALHNAKLCPVGIVTAQRLEHYGLKADLLPETARAEKLLDLLRGCLKPTDRVLLPQSSAARPLLRKGLDALCRLDVVDVYDSVPPQVETGRIRGLLAAGEIRAVTFTSSAAAENFDKTVGLDALKGVACFSIGAVTSQTLREHGIEPYESRESTMDSLVECLAAHREEY